MPIFSYVAVFSLIWVISAFAVMPFGIRSFDDDQAETLPGTVSSAPTNFRPRRIAFRTTIVATVLCLLFFANIHYGWLTVDFIKRLVPVPEHLQKMTLYQ